MSTAPSDPSFSVLITTRNRSSLLRRALHSAITQDLSAEIVVVDDASTDGTAAGIAEAKEAANGRNRQLISHRNKVVLGQSASMSIGINLASRGWIKSLDD